MPSHARRVKAYSDPVPLFQRYGAEDQLSAMYDPVVQLKSGGYLVINPTEALVSIDINSGRSTKEHGIEQTALSTNLEAAREIARQLRLRDMAGLVVIDFIDMEHGSNVRKVEKAMKDALKNDRARIQVGRISGFGLMEMSRQRLRTGVLEATTRQCPHCDGTGLVRTASSAGLSALRLIEDEAAKGKGTTITLYASTEAAIYLLNAKRADLAEIESRYGVTVEVVPEGENEGAKMRVASSGPRPTTTPKFEPIVEDDEDDIELLDEDQDEDEAEEETSEESDEQRRGKRRRRRGGRGRNKSREDGEERSEEESEEPAESTERPERDEADEDGEDRPKKRRRRGGRRRKRREGGDEAGTEEGGEVTGEDAGEDFGEQAPEEASLAAEEASADEAPAVEEKPKRRSRRKKAVEEATEAAPVAEDAPSEAAPTGEEAPVVEAEAKPKRRSRSRKAAEEAPAQEAPADGGSADLVAGEEPAPAKPKRTRRKKADAETVGAEPAPAEVAPEAAEAETAPSAANDSNGGEETPADEKAAAGKPRRGWWQRTFGE
jgi:ribonuclease E